MRRTRRPRLALAVHAPVARRAAPWSPGGPRRSLRSTFGPTNPEGFEPSTFGSGGRGPSRSKGKPETTNARGSGNRAVGVSARPRIYDRRLAGIVRRSLGPVPFLTASRPIEQGCDLLTLEQVGVKGGEPAEDLSGGHDGTHGPPPMFQGTPWQVQRFTSSTPTKLPQVRWSPQKAQAQRQSAQPGRSRQIGYSASSARKMTPGIRIGSVTATATAP